MAAMKQRQAVLRLQKLHASSMLHSTPPMGAPKAAEIPALTPADLRATRQAGKVHASVPLR